MPITRGVGKLIFDKQGVLKKYGDGAWREVQKIMSISLL